MEEQTIEIKDKQAIEIEPQKEETNTSTVETSNQLEMENESIALNQEFENDNEAPKDSKPDQQVDETEINYLKLSSDQEKMDLELNETMIGTQSTFLTEEQNQDVKKEGIHVLHFIIY